MCAALALAPEPTADAGLFARPRAIIYIRHCIPDPRNVPNVDDPAAFHERSLEAHDTEVMQQHEHCLRLADELNAQVVGKYTSAWPAAHSVSLHKIDLILSQVRAEHVPFLLTIDPGRLSIYSAKGRMVLTELERLRCSLITSMRSGLYSVYPVGMSPLASRPRLVKPAEPDNHRW